MTEPNLLLLALGAGRQSTVHGCSPYGCMSGPDVGRHRACVATWPLGMRYELLEPEGPCSSPDGHTELEVRSASGDVPVRVWCQRCGRDYTVVTFTAERA